MALVALRRVGLTPRLALRIGLVIVVLQWITMTAVRILKYHEPLWEESSVILYLARLWIVLPGPLLASVVADREFADAPKTV